MATQEEQETRSSLGQQPMTPKPAYHHWRVPATCVPDLCCHGNNKRVVNIVKQSQFGQSQAPKQCCEVQKKIIVCVKK